MIIRKRNYGINVHLPDLRVPQVETLNLLGITFNSKCTWSDHVSKIVSSASRRMYAIRVIKPYIGVKDLKLLYKTTFRSSFDYCYPLFVGLSATDCTRLERIQRRFHRLICGEHCENDCFETLTVRRQRLSLNFFQQVLTKDHILSDLLPTQSSSGRFLIPEVRTLRPSNSFVICACKLHNSYFHR